MNKTQRWTGRDFRAWSIIVAAGIAAAACALSGCCWVDPVPTQGTWCFYCEDGGDNAPDMVAVPDLGATYDFASSDDLTSVLDLGKKHSCTGTILHVPADCPDIQSAANVASTVKVGAIAPQTNIIVAPGIYHENVLIGDGSNVSIIGDGAPGDVRIDGGKFSAISGQSTGSTMLALSNLTVTSNQTQPNYATIDADQGLTLTMKSVVVEAATVGVSVAYEADLEISNCTISGTSPDAIGVAWQFTDAGSRLFWNSFNNLKAGVERCSGSKPTTNPLGSVFADTNTFNNVGTSYTVNPATVCN